jgi:hypothetical protein
MWHRLNTRDFDMTGGVMGSRSAGREWGVCEAYELTGPRDTLEGDDDSYIVVPEYPYEPATFDKWRRYEPLEETPDLFLKFARLHGAKDRPEAMLDWVCTYGALGHGKSFGVAGTPQDSKGFWETVGQAAGLLALYEAVLNRDSHRVQTAILIEFPYVDIQWQMYNELPDKPAHLDQTFVTSLIAESVEEIYDGDYLLYALETVVHEVQRMVGALCRPALSVEEGSSDPARVTATWNFKSLLGAMYLQMYWLMAAGSELTRCEYCGRLISLARPYPESRKRRRDKRFCDDACRQAHHRSKKRAEESSY